LVFVTELPKREFVVFLILANSMSNIIVLFKKRKQPNEKKSCKNIDKERQELKKESIVEY
jgi:hypothetical protein